MTRPAAVVDLPATTGEWARIAFSLYFATDDFRDETFLQILGEPPFADEWLFWDDAAGIHTHVSVDHLEGEEQGELPFEETVGDDGVVTHRTLPVIVSVSSYQGSPIEEFGTADLPSHDVLFRALRESTADDFVFHPLCSIDLFFDAPPARWRMPLLANPPEFDEMSDEFGRILLGGLTLYFRESPAALLEVRLESSPTMDQLYVAPRFGMHVQRDELPALFSVAILKAGRFARVFVHDGLAAGREQEE